MSDYGDIVAVLMAAEANREGWEQDRHEAAAEAILASDWLAQRDRRVRAEAVRQAAQAMRDEFSESDEPYYDSERDHYASEWMDGYASRIEAASE